MAAFAPGEQVHTPLGKGVVLEVRNRRVLVRVQARDVLLASRDVRVIATESSTPLRARRRKTSASASAFPAAPPGAGETHRFDDPGVTRGATLDVHGLTVEQALEAVD